MLEYFRRCGLVLLGTTALTPCRAQPDLPNEMDFYSPRPIVLSASRLARPLAEAPAAVSVIDREMIEASGFTQIADLLRLAPGFQVGLNTINNLTAVTYHGQADTMPRRMEVLVDGHSVYSSLFSVDWHDLGVVLPDVDRIEVVRGPNSPTYGSNAFTATINIITRPRYANPGWFAQTTAGSNSTRQATLRHVGSLGRIDYRLSAGYDQSDGFQGRNDQQLVRSLNLHGWTDLNHTDSLEVQLGAREGPIGRGGDDTLFNPLGPRIGTNAVASNRQLLRWNRVLGPGRDTSVRLYHQFRREQDPVTVGNLSGLMAVPPAAIPQLFPGHQDEVIRAGLFDYTDERYDLEWQFNDASDERLRWVAGAGLRLNRARSLVQFGRLDPVRNQGSRAFADMAYRLADGWLLNASAMLEHSDTLNHAMSYRLALNHQFQPDQTVRASVTRAQRDTGLFSNHMALGLHFANGDALNLFGYSPGGLKPEQMVAWEIGWLGQWFARRLTLEAKGFREEIRRETTAAAGAAPEAYPDGALILGTGPGVTITGLEGQLQFRSGPRDLVSLQWSIADADDRYDPSSGRPSEAPRTPRRTVSLLASHRFENDWQLSFGYYHLDAMRWEVSGPAAAKPLIGAYDRIDLRAARRFRFPGQDLLLELIAQNVGNGAYAEFRPDNRFETRYFLRASLQFH